MKVVVATNVIAYYLLGTEAFVEEVKAFWSMVTAPLAPSSWEAKVANVLWMSTRAGIVKPPDALAKLEYASALGIQSVALSSLWRGALTRSVQKTVAVYDTLFVELAEREGVSMATFDAAVLKAFPGIARRPSELLSRKSRT